MENQGALAALPGRRNPTLDDVLAAGQCITIRSFQAVLTREAREFLPGLRSLALAPPTIKR